MILVSSLYAFGPDLFQELHGASMRHSLNVLAVQVNVWLGPSSAMPGTVARIDNINAILGLHVQALYQKPTMHPHCESFPVQRAFFLRQVGKFINLRIGPARHRID
jgi:hypothetical protein